MAFLGAYTLHERLLLRLAACASPTALDSTSTSLDIDHSLSLYVMTCCGPVCKIWNMHVREMPQGNKTTFEPIRYDLELLEEIDIQDRRKHAKFAQWINNIHTFGSTNHLDALCNDAAKAQKLQGSNAMDWTREYALVYDYSHTGGDCRRIRPVRKTEMQIAYKREEFVPEEPVAREVVDFVDGGRMALVASRARRRVGDSKGAAIKHASGQKRDLISPPLLGDGEISTSFSTSSAMGDEPPDLATAHSSAESNLRTSLYLFLQVTCIHTG